MDQACIDFGISETGCTLISAGLYFGYFLFFIALIAVVVLPVMNALKAPKELVKSGAGLVGLVVVFLISYSLSGDEVTAKTASLGTTAESSKMIGAGLIMLYFVFFLAMIGLAYSFLNKAIK
jgi:hypothetical protein